MIAITIALLATGGAWMVYSSQQAEFARQRMVSELDLTARMAVNDMAKRLRLARVGSDPANAISVACAGRIIFQSNRRGVYTFLKQASVINNATISVDSVAGFTVGDNVALTDWASWQTRTITGMNNAVNPPTVTLSAALASVFPGGSGVFQVLSTTLELDLAPKQLKSGALVLATNVKMNANGYPPSGVALFRYFDQSNVEMLPAAGATALTTCLTAGQRTMVREVIVSLSLESPRVTNVAAQTRSTVTHQTGVKLRLPSPS